MRKLSFSEFVETYARQEDVVGQLPAAIRLNATRADPQTWSELERRLKAGGADEEMCQVGKRIWRRYRVAARTTLA